MQKQQQQQMQHLMNNNSFKTTKHLYKGVKYMSDGEVNFAKLIDKHNNKAKWEYQPEKIEILPKFTAASGKKYPAMNYEPDFKYNNILIEVKGQNDNIFTFRKGKAPTIKNNSELYRLRHKIIDGTLTEKGYLFLLVRNNELKTPEYAGMFWDKDFEQMKKFKTQGRKDLCAKVPRIIERINYFIKNMANCYLNSPTCESQTCGGCQLEYGQTQMQLNG